jgi:hypothetical protein
MVINPIDVASNNLQDHVCLHLVVELKVSGRPHLHGLTPRARCVEHQRVQPPRLQPGAYTRPLFGST